MDQKLRPFTRGTPLAAPLSMEAVVEPMEETRTVALETQMTQMADAVEEHSRKRASVREVGRSGPRDVEVSPTANPPWSGTKTAFSRKRAEHRSGTHLNTRELRIYYSRFL